MKTLTEKITYLFSKINWGASFLDAEAIDIMNTIGSDIKKLEEENKHLKVLDIEAEGDRNKLVLKNADLIQQNEELKAQVETLTTANKLLRQAL